MIYKVVKDQSKTAYNTVENILFKVCHIHQDLFAVSNIPSILFLEHNFPHKCDYLHFDGTRCMNDVSESDKIGKMCNVIEANLQFEEYQSLLELQIKLLNITKDQFNNFLKFTILLLAHFNEKFNKSAIYGSAITNTQQDGEKIRVFRLEEDYIKEKFFGFFNVEKYQFKTPDQNMHVLAHTNNMTKENLELQRDLLTRTVNDFLRSIAIYYLLITGVKQDKSFISVITEAFQNAIGPITLAKNQKHLVPPLHPHLRLQFDKLGWIIMKDLKNRYENLENIFLD